MNISIELINEIKNKANIVDVISNYLPLIPKGKNYFGICPFHDDHSPSMSVSPDKQIYKCFTCGATGNVFTFIANYEHINFYEAVRKLGNKLGYDLGTSRTYENKNQKYFDIYDTACKFYQNSLNTNLGKNALEYLEKRQIDKETIKKFRIGLSANNLSLTDYLINKNIALKDLISLGLSNDLGKDLFNNRIMFPLYDLEGNVVAFSGRIYNTKDSSKYINTKETIIFKKGNILYNYHNAKENLKKNDSIIVMEGFMDVIRASTVGINNCIATMGTALTKQNAQLLKKMANNVILCFDGDKAGEDATTSAINVFKEIDLTPKVVRLEEDLDPDEYILKYGKDAFQNKLDYPISAIDFMMNIHKVNKNLNNIEELSKYLEDIIKELTSSSDQLLVDLTLKKMSKEYDVSYDLLLKKYQSYLKEENKKVPTKVAIPEKKKQTQQEIAAKNLLYYMIYNENIINYVSNKIKYIPIDTLRKLYNEIVDYYQKYQTLPISDLINYINMIDIDNLNILNEIINLNLKEEVNDEEINDYITVINSYPLKKRVAELNKELKNETDPKEQAKLLKEILSLKGVKE